MTDLDTLAPDFVEAAHTLVYCSVSTVDRPAARAPASCTRSGSGTGAG
jgi:hypothetical protein